MQFAAQPVNIEGGGGPALRVSVALSGAPPAAGAGFALWAARLPDALDPDTLQALAAGTFSLERFAPVRQDGPRHGLRRAQSLSAVYGPGGAVTLEGSLYAPGTDQAPRTANSPSWDVAEHQAATLERSDGPWLVAATALLPDGTVLLARGGLSQAAGQEHLAGVCLSPSDLAPEVEAGQWLQETLASLKPVFDARMTALGGGADLSLKGVEFTDERQRDDWPVLYVIPEAERDAPDGLSAPDRSEVRLSFTIRAVAYGDRADVKSRALAQLLGSARQMLNTRKLRRTVLPSGRLLDLARATDVTFGRTEDGWDEAGEITWSCTMVETGIF